MIQRFLTPPRRLNIDFQILNRAFLPDKIIKRQRPKRAVTPVPNLAICADYAVMLVQLLAQFLKRHFNQIIKRRIIRECVIGGGHSPQGIGLTDTEIFKRGDRIITQAHIREAFTTLTL